MKKREVTEATPIAAEERLSADEIEGTRDITAVMRSAKKQAHYAGPNVPVLDLHATGKVPWNSCRVTALSPSHKEAEIFWTHIAALIPQLKQTRRRLVAPKPNKVAVAIWVAIDGDFVLLGSDLEETNDPECGWSVIAGSSLMPPGKASVVKIPHHGSVTGHSEEMWAQMVATGADAVLTPFTNGDVHLPSAANVERITRLAPRSFSTSSRRAHAPTRRAPEVDRQIRATVGRLRTAEPRISYPPSDNSRQRRLARWALRDGKTLLNVDLPSLPNGSPQLRPRLQARGCRLEGRNTRSVA
jgi:hypothetical protein